jgi:hypothetical protein
LVTGAVDVHDRAHFWLTRRGPAERVVDGQKVTVGQVVLPLDQHGLALVHLDRRTGNAAAIAPEPCGFQIPVHRREDLAHSNPKIRDFLGRILRILAHALGLEQRQPR